MQAIVSPGPIAGTLEAPPSKSDFQRACAAALLHTGTTEIRNPGTSADDRAALAVAEALGLQILSQEADRLTVSSIGTVQPRHPQVSCGESGLCARLFTPIAAQSETPVTLSGTGTLRDRPMQPLYDWLPDFGITVDGPAPLLPITVQGPLQPHSCTLDGSLSSQFISGLLFAFAAQANTTITLRIRNAVSVPYLRMSAATLQAFGFSVAYREEGFFEIHPTQKQSSVLRYAVEGDWSGASAFCIAGALSGPVLLRGLKSDSLQADAALLPLLETCGAQLEVQEEGILFRKSPSLRPFQFDVTHSPDLAPVLAILAGSIPGTSVIHGTHRLEHKESHRLHSIAHLLEQLGVAFQIHPDALQIQGGTPMKSCTVDGHHDHRIVMAAALAGLQAEGPVSIFHAEAVAKSYPDFFRHLSALGGKVAFPEGPGTYL